MPLQGLVEYFNQRIIEEQGLAEPPMIERGGQVEGRFAGLRLASEFSTIRRADLPAVVIGHDATLKTLSTEGSRTIAAEPFHSADVGGVINLDRLCRTIHMLNYLPMSHEDGYLFLQVHPRHVLGVKRNHGAYFEEVIFRCGLSPGRVVVSVAVTPSDEPQLKQMMDGLKNYQSRGYGTALSFDSQADEGFVERCFIELFYRFTPDFVRLGSRFLSRLRDDLRNENELTAFLLSVVDGLNTELFVEGINDENDAGIAKTLRASLVKGDYYEKQSWNVSGKDWGKRCVLA